MEGAWPFLEVQSIEDLGPSENLYWVGREQCAGGGCMCV